MKPDVKFLWNRFTMREALLLGFCATFIVVTKATLRMKLGISGHAMFFLMFFLLLARGIVPKTGAATLVGLLAGGISIALGLAHRGPIIMLNFVLPALVVDFAGIFLTRMTSSYLLCLLIGGLAAASKGATEAVTLFLTGAPADVILLKTLIEVSGGVMFGMLGSLPVPAIIRKLQTNRLIVEPAVKVASLVEDKQTRS
ncbi:MAG: hypothetical protein EG825_08030 [Rhodocyclaceae bacterium]|nr:hypothetical protein [Rhodocyclaceae bacterium]